MARFTRWTSPRSTIVGGTSRRAFLRSSGGYAAGAATVVGIPVAVLLETDSEAATVAPKTVKNPTTDVPEGPVMAYVHDAKKGIVVIMDGTNERTVQDRALVQKLLHAPKKPTKRRRPKRTARTRPTMSASGGRR